ncbi:MAG TPA: hypothetical protein VKI45_01155, partial [Allosphingosinicella sp.]|nr:hypothetical protein [Allosphingosinicella sp.]
MSTRPPLSAEERDLLAAERAMGLLDGAERRDADALAARDPDFRAAVARWTVHLAPMLDEVDPVDPPAAAWSAIESRIAPTASNDAGSSAAPSNVVQLRRKMNLWRG